MSEYHKARGRKAMQSQEVFASNERPDENDLPKSVSTGVKPYQPYPDPLTGGFLDSGSDRSVEPTRDPDNGSGILNELQALDNKISEIHERNEQLTRQQNALKEKIEDLERRFKAFEEGQKALFELQQKILEQVKLDR